MAVAKNVWHNCYASFPIYDVENKNKPRSPNRINPNLVPKLFSILTPIGRLNILKIQVAFIPKKNLIFTKFEVSFLANWTLFLNIIRWHFFCSFLLIWFITNIDWHFLTRSHFHFRAGQSQNLSIFKKWHFLTFDYTFLNGNCNGYWRSTILPMVLKDPQ